MKENEVKLKACSCGRTFHIVNVDSADDTFFITCKCGVYVEHTLKNKLIEIWNRRPSAKE